jgi:hypothetical protein
MGIGRARILTDRHFLVQRRKPTPMEGSERWCREKARRVNELTRTTRRDWDEIVQAATP